MTINLRVSKVCNLLKKEKERGRGLDGLEKDRNRTGLVADAGLEIVKNDTQIETLQLEMVLNKYCCVLLLNFCRLVPRERRFKARRKFAIK